MLFDFQYALILAQYLWNVDRIENIMMFLSLEDLELSMSIVMH